ncbi:MAG: hypothetical protein V2J08_05900 [Desulfotignum sp.]|nr:hypothetical protein [Desulfotignum sp.]
MFSQNAAAESDDTLNRLFHQVEQLDIQYQGYTLCHILTPEQRKTAEKNPLASGSPDLYKFADDTLHVVADARTHRVLVMYEKIDSASREQLEIMVGRLFLAFDEPTISAHDKVIYWAWGEKGKFSRYQFDLAKEKKQPLSILATVKLNSELSIMEKTGDEAFGDVYVIISSDPVLRFFQ